MIIAVAQFSARPCDIGANAARAAALVSEAGARGASLVVFAELAVTGYELDAIVAGQDRLTMEPDDPRLAPVREACRAAGVAAVVNCAGRTAAGPTISSFVYGPDGAPLTRYDKTCVTDRERAAGFVPGSGDGGRFTLGGVAFGLLVCFDAHFPELTARAVADGCRVQLASSLYGRGNGEEEVRTVFPALARDHGLYVLLANHTGPAGPYDGCGRSGVWGPDGLAVASAREGEELVLAELPLG
ncbi:carbon-nitrogen hydrolase family protein [Streptomyces albireticuli]|uniref:carbon-nitrogen hydrolase family protein n=1 Tax=Streptomyces albireticuli TaxID=1940 RepID=UPI0036877E10